MRRAIHWPRSPRSWRRGDNGPLCASVRGPMGRYSRNALKRAQRTVHTNRANPACCARIRAPMLTRYLQPGFEAFTARAQHGNLVPVWVELAADYETPLSVFRQLDDGRHSFLLESAELTQHSGRYSLLGSEPRLIFTARGREIQIEEGVGNVRRYTAEGDP